MRATGPAQWRGRFHQDLAEIYITSFNFRSFLRRLRHPAENRYIGYLKNGKIFSEAVAKKLQRRSMDRHIFFAYDTGFLEAAETAKDRGAKTIVNQIDPGVVEFEIVQEEERAFPDWALEPLRVPEVYNERRRREWELADRILVNSEWSAKALEKQGVPREKLRIIPLGFEGVDRGLPERENDANVPLNILFLGQVILRKGISYLIRAAELLVDAPVHFHVVGPLGIELKNIGPIPGNLTFHGPVPRSAVDQFYREADVFVLPTLSDGFAITQLEAMAQGVPVLATPCCGEVVTHGTDGWIVPERNPQAIADTIREILDSRTQLPAMRSAAREKSKQFGLDRLAKSLLALEQELLDADS